VQNPFCTRSAKSQAIDSPPNRFSALQKTKVDLASNIMGDGKSWGADERRRSILDELTEHGSVQIDHLADQLDVSRMTVHRDLNQLEEKGLLRKVRGGATLESSVLFESSYDHRKQNAVSRKRACAESAAERLSPGQAVMIDDGTTTALLEDYVSDFTPITVITNSRPLADEMRKVKDINLIILGGKYNPAFEACFGFICEKSVSNLHSDALFLSTSAINKNELYHQNEDIARLKRSMMDVSSKIFLLVDNRKFEKSGMYKFASIDEFDCVFVGGELKNMHRDNLEKSDANFEVSEK